MTASRSTQRDSEVHPTRGDACPGLKALLRGKLWDDGLFEGRYGSVAERVQRDAKAAGARAAERAELRCVVAERSRAGGGYRAPGRCTSCRSARDAFHDEIEGS